MITLGGVDRIVDGDMAEAARAFAEELPERPVPVSQRDVPAFGADLIEGKRAALAKRAKGQQSPLLNLDALLWAAMPFSDARPKERALHLDLRHSAESRALRHAFFAERAVSKPAAIKGADARDVTAATVVGGGLMGAGIATSMLNAGLSVTLIERDAEAAAAAYARVDGLVSSALKRGKATEAQVAERLARFKTSDDYAQAAESQLASEAVVEDVSVKQEVFGKLAAVMDADAILATNTSYLDPQLIFDGIANPSRCLGLHFFSPAHVMKLLEIVKTPETSAEVLAPGFALGKKMRKVSVLSGICDGFIGNRMLSVYRRAADYLLADGALPYEIDAAMRGFGMPMGPYELQDLTGLQIAWANRKRQAATRDPAERYVPIADRLCEMDRLGQRAGKGWYDYEDGNRTPQRSAEVEAMVVEYSGEAGIERRSFTAEEIAARLMAVLANEGARIVEEGIAETDAAVDVVKMQGYGFPRWRGGPMQYAQESGWGATAELMPALSAEAPGSWILSKRVIESAEQAA
jgi:3-hydroxyacyl-CoA dehydrogenase